LTILLAGSAVKSSAKQVGMGWPPNRMTVEIEAILPVR
jgi:hypothetical protein